MHKKRACLRALFVITESIRSGKRCRIRILKSLYINRIIKERFRCTMFWRYAKSIGLLAVVSAFQYESKDTFFFENTTLLSLYCL